MHYKIAADKFRVFVTIDNCDIFALAKICNSREALINYSMSLRLVGLPVKLLLLEYEREFALCVRCRPIVIGVTGAVTGAPSSNKCHHFFT